MPALDPTGVVPGDYGGAVVNEAGQFTFIPPQWPASALPVFPLSASGGGASGSVLASDVTYVAAVGNNYVLSSNVQTAFNQVDAALTAINAAATNSGVVTLTVDNGLVLNGTATNPVVGMANSGISAGTYAGFTVNARGQITAYSAPAAATPTFTGNNGVAVTAPSPNTWVIAGVAATYSTPGVVGLVNPANAITGSPQPGGGGYVVTWDGLISYFTGNNVVKSGLGLSVTGPERTINLAFQTLPFATSLVEDAVIPAYTSTTTTTAQITLSDLRRQFKGGQCAGRWDISVATRGPEFNILNVTGSAGNLIVTMINPQPNTSYGVVISAVNGKLVEPFYTVVNAGTFTVQWTTTGSTATAVSYFVYSLD